MSKIRHFINLFFPMVTGKFVSVVISLAMNLGFYYSVWNDKTQFLANLVI